MEKGITKIATTQDGWIVIDTTSSAGTEPTDLAVTERTYLTVQAAIAAAVSGDEEISIHYSISSKHNQGRFRCLGITENSSVIYQIYFGTLEKDGGSDCELAKAGQLAFTIGTQVSIVNGYELADAVTVTEYCWNATWLSTSPGSDLVAEAAIDLMGANVIVAVSTTVECDCKLLLKGF